MQDDLISSSRLEVIWVPLVDNDVIFDCTWAYRASTLLPLRRFKLVELLRWRFLLPFLLGVLHGTAWILRFQRFDHFFMLFGVAWLLDLRAYWWFTNDLRPSTLFWSGVIGIWGPCQLLNMRREGLVNGFGALTGLRLLLAIAIELFFVYLTNTDIRLRSVVLHLSWWCWFRCICLIFDGLNNVILLASRFFKRVVAPLVSSHLARFHLLELFHWWRLTKTQLHARWFREGLVVVMLVDSESSCHVLLDVFWARSFLMGDEATVFRD